MSAGVCGGDWAARQRCSLIVSRAALEYRYDPLGAIRSMAACLEPGGRMVHKIDFRDHGRFTPAHPKLTFRRFPRAALPPDDAAIRPPDPLLLHRYSSLANELRQSAGLDVTILVTSLVGEGEITPHVPLADLPAGSLRRAVTLVEAERHRFAGEFTKVSAMDLAVTGIFWTGVRPSPQLPA